MTTISTITELLSLSGSQYRLYDIGRKITKLSKEQFNKIELNQLPYPFPSQGHAFVAIAFWQKKSPQPYLWFVKIPLDERGLINQGARNHFIAIIVEALGANISIDPSEQQEALLKNNPYHFTPSQYKLAFINSLLKVDLKQPASPYFNDVKNYLASSSFDQWKNIGVQGITDFSARLNVDNNQSSLCSNFEKLPEEVLNPFCNALENVTLDAQLIEKIVDKLNQPSSLSTELNTNLIRSLASSCQHIYVKDFFNSLLDKNLLCEEVLIAIAARCWLALIPPVNMMRYLELLVKNDNPSLFSALFKDLVSIPDTRAIVLQCMREPTRSEGLSKEIGLLFNQKRH